MSAASADRKFIVLDGLRGVAALCVVQLHTQSLLVGNVLPTNYLAVGLFFLLSGFVLAHAYEGRLREGMTFRTFIGLRLIRLYPLYLMALAIALGLAVIDMVAAVPDTTWPNLGLWVLTGVLFLPAPPWATSAEGAVFPLVPPAWSLFFELVVNCAFGLVARFLSTRVLALIVALSGVWAAAVIISYGTINTGFHWNNFFGGFARVTFLFFSGVLLYRFRDRAPVLRGAAWPCLAALLLLFSVRHEGAPWRMAYDMFAIGVALPLLVWIAAAARPSAASGRIFSLLGATSYAVYVLHAPLLRWAERVSPSLGVDLHAFAPFSGLLFIGVLLGFSWAADRWFDTPVRARLVSAFKNTRRKAVEAPAL